MAAPGGPRRARSGLAFTVALDDMIDAAPEAPAPAQPPLGRKPLAEAPQPAATATGTYRQRTAPAVEQFYVC